ncbi:MAG: ParA family protein [Bacteroidota bacterium]
MIISSISYKGGVGKTTIAQNLAVYYATKGYKVCIVDADNSQNSVMWTVNRADIEPRIPAIPNDDFRTITKTITDLYEKDGYDIILIDSPPALSRVASKIILSSHIVLIPVSVTGAQDLWTTQSLLEHYEELQIEKGERIAAFFTINNYEPHIKLHQAALETLEEFKSQFSIPILDSKLHRRSVYGEATSQGLGVIECKNPKASNEIARLAEEILLVQETV